MRVTLKKSGCVMRPLFFLRVEESRVEESRSRESRVEESRVEESRVEESRVEELRGSSLRPSRLCVTKKADQRSDRPVDSLEAA